MIINGSRFFENKIATKLELIFQFRTFGARSQEPEKQTPQAPITPSASQVSPSLCISQFKSSFKANIY